MLTKTDGFIFGMACIAFLMALGYDGVLPLLFGTCLGGLGGVVAIPALQKAKLIKK